MNVEMLYFEGCPGRLMMARRLDQLARELDFAWTPVLVGTPEAAEARHFHGSPSLHIDGVDPFAAPGTPVGLTCRIYATPDGPASAPDLSALRAVLLAARDSPSRG